MKDHVTALITSRAFCKKDHFETQQENRLILHGQSSSMLLISEKNNHSNCDVIQLGLVSEYIAESFIGSYSVS